MENPISLRLSDNLERDRVTTLFRLILAIPHFVWLWIWGIAIYIAVIANWFVTLFQGRSPDGLYDFIAQYLRYQTQVHAYIFLIADPYPGFSGTDDYPTDLTVGPSVHQNRWITGFRMILIIPAAIVASLLWLAGELVAIFAWFAILFTGRIPMGTQYLLGWIVRFNAQVNGYAWIVTDRYPDFSTVV